MTSWHGANSSALQSWDCGVGNKSCVSSATLFRLLYNLQLHQVLTETEPVCSELSYHKLSLWLSSYIYLKELQRTR